jgi:hypothetical protein
MNIADVTAVVTALSSLAGDILEASARKGEDPVDTIEALRASLRLGVEQSAQAELDARFKE